MSSTLTSVSTLLTTVGLPKRPSTTGNGGLLRGSPRLPSIDSKIAVSSPQMYAPAPLRISIVEAEALAEHVVSRNGTADAIAADGRLTVVLDDGETTLVGSGEVEIAGS